MHVICTTAVVSKVVWPTRDICTASLQKASSGPLVVPSWVTQNSTRVVVPTPTPRTDNGSLSSRKWVLSTIPSPLAPEPHEGFTWVEALSPAGVAAFHL